MDEEEGGKCTFVERKEWTLDNEYSGQRRIIKKGHSSGQWGSTALTSGHFAVDEKCISEDQSDGADVTRRSLSALTDDSADDSVFLHEHETNLRDVERSQSSLGPERMARWTFENLGRQSSTPIKSIGSDNASLTSSDIIDSPCVEGGVRILRQVRRSVSIDKDGRRSQLSNRLVERRRTLEVDQEDLSGVGTRHVSTLEFRVGPNTESGVEEDRQISEINVVWGKIVDAHDAVTVRRNLEFTDNLLQSPTMTGSIDDSLDYWSADMSSDSFMTFDSNDTFVDTGDSMYASDSNISFIERSEILLDVSSRSLSVEPQSVVVSKIVGDKSVEVTRLESVSSCEDTIELVESPWQVSKVFIDRRRTVDVDKPESGWSLATVGAKKQLFRVSEEIALLGRGVKRSSSRDMDSEDSSYHTDTERIVTVISEVDDGSGSEPSLISPFDDSRTYGSQEDIRDIHDARGVSASVTVVSSSDIGVNLVESGVLRNSASPGSGHSPDAITTSKSQEDLLDLQADSRVALEHRNARHDTYTSLDEQETRHLSKESVSLTDSNQSNIHMTVSTDTSSRELEMKHSSNIKTNNVDDSCLSSVDKHVTEIQDSNVQSSQSFGESVTSGNNLNLVLVSHTISEDEDRGQLHEMEDFSSDAAASVNIHQINDVVTTATLVNTLVTEDVYSNDVTDVITISERTEEISLTDGSVEISATSELDVTYVTERTDEISLTDTADDLSVTDNTDEISITDTLCNITVTDQIDELFITEKTDEISLAERTDTKYITDVSVTDRDGEVCDKDENEYISLNLSDVINETDDLHVIDKTIDTINTSAESSVISVTKDLHVDTKADDLSGDGEIDDFTLVVNKKKNRRKKKQPLETADAGVVFGTATIDGSSETRQDDVSQGAPVQCSDTVESAGSTERSEDFIVEADATSQLRRPHAFGGVNLYLSGEPKSEDCKPALKLDCDNSSTPDDRIAEVKEPDDIAPVGDATSGTQVGPREGFHGDVDKQTMAEQEQDEKDFMSGFISGPNMTESGDAGFFCSEDGTLLNLSTSHRRILKPHRRFTKASSNAASDAGDAQEGYVPQAALPQADGSDKATESTPGINVETSPASESSAIQSDEPRPSPKSTSRSKRKRDVASARGSTANVSLPDARDSGGSDVSQEDASSPVEVDRAEQFMEAATPTVIKRGPSTATGRFDAYVNRISENADDTVEPMEIDSAATEKADANIEDTTTFTALFETKDTATHTVEDITLTESETEDTTLTVAETEDTTLSVIETEVKILNVYETEDTTLTVAETEDTTLSVTETEDTTRTVSETEDTALTVAEKDDKTLTVAEIEDTTILVTETEDKTFTVAETEDTALSVTETEDKTISGTEKEDKTLTVAETEDTTISLSETEVTTLTVYKTEDTTLTVTETEDATLTVAETEDTTLSVTETEDTTLTVSETEDTSLTVAETEDLALTVAETEDTTLSVTETEDKKLIATETEDTKLSVAETEDTTLSVTETEDTTLTAVETEDTPLSVTETDDISLTVVEIEDTTLSVTETEDKTLTVAEIEDTKLTVAETEDKTLTVAKTEDSTLTVAEIEDTKLTVAETEDKTRTVAKTEDSTLNVPKSLIPKSKQNKINKKTKKKNTAALTVAQTENATLTVAETEDTALKVAETEDTILSVAKTEDTTLTVAETEDTILSVAKTEDTTLTVAETEDTTLKVAKTEDTTLTVAETEDTTLKVAETEDSTLTVAKTEDSTISVTEAEDTTLPVDELPVQKTKQKKKKRNKKKKEAKEHNLATTLQETVDDITTQDAVETIDDTSTERVHVTTDVAAKTTDVTAHVATETVDVIAQVATETVDVTAQVATETTDVTAQVATETVDATAHVATETTDITAHVATETTDITAHVATETTDVTAQVATETVDVIAHVATETVDVTTDVATETADVTAHVATETVDVTTDVATEKDGVTTDVATETTDVTAHVATETVDVTTDVATETVYVTTDVATETTDVTAHVATETVDFTTDVDTETVYVTTDVATETMDATTTIAVIEKSDSATAKVYETVSDTTSVAMETAYNTTDAATEAAGDATVLDAVAVRDILLSTTGVEGTKTLSTSDYTLVSELKRNGTGGMADPADTVRVTDSAPESTKKRGKKKKNKKQKKTLSETDKTETSVTKLPEIELRVNDTVDRVLDAADTTGWTDRGADTVGQVGSAADSTTGIRVDRDRVDAAADLTGPEPGRGVDEGMDSDSGPGPNIERSEETFTPMPPRAFTFKRRLFEEVLKNKAHAEEVVEQGPDSSHGPNAGESSESGGGGEITLTPAARLMSELSLLETAAREQTESLQLAVAHKEHYDKQMLILSKGIAEAQQKLQASPVSASSVGDLKKQMQERNNLAAQIKKAQVILNEVQEKSRQLTLDSAMLNPAIFRKHYLPDSAYSDFFSATAQHQRGSATLPPFSNLFYDSLPSFSSSELPLLFDPTTESTLQLPADNLNAAQFAGDVGSLDFVLPKKIPPPKTDSIPRPTWSECVPSKSDPASGRSGNYTQSIDSPLSTVGSSSFESGSSALPPGASALHGGSSKIKAPPSSSYAAEAGPEATLTSFDSGVDSTVSSLADKLMTSSAQLPKTPPVGGSPTEILRMLGEDFAGVEITSGEKEDETSWEILQQQIHAKEKELQEAVEMQEKFQQLVQDVTTKMEKVSMRLTQSPASAVSSLETQLDEYQETLKEMESIKGDISQVKEWGEKLISSPDSEGYKTMESTLTMLQDRFNNLETQAEEKGRKLLAAQEVLDQHIEMKKDYKKNVKNLAEWIHEMRLRQETMTLTSDDPVYLRTLLDDNKDMQEEINNRLCQLSDLALQCDSICENETPESAEKLRTQLAELQNDLGEFKLKVIEKQSNLRTDLKEIEKRKQEMEEHEANKLRMQKLMTDSKQVTSSTSLLPDDHNMDFQELASDINIHKQLVQQISDHQIRSPPPTLHSTLEREMRENWLRLGREQDDKRDNLQTILSTSRLPGDVLTLSTYGESKQKHFDKQFREVLDKVRDVTGDCKALLRQKNISPSDITTFEQQYQSVQQDIANLLDLAQEKLFSTPATNEEQIKQNEELQKQLRTLQQEITTLDREADTLFRKANCTNSDVMVASMKTLKDRLKMLTAAAESQGSELCAADLKWKQYQSDVSVLKKRLQDVQELILQPMPSLTLEQLVENNQRIETELNSCEAQLEELKRKESTLTYPKEAYLSDLSALQSHFIELQKWAMEKRSNVQKSISVHDQYQKMLKDYETFLETAEAKLKSDSITARDLNHLKQQLSAHKDFFSDLEANKAMLDALANKCNEYTRSSLQHKLSALISLTSVLVDKASLQGQRLERLVKEWTDCDSKLNQVQKKLHAIELNIPPHVNCADSLTTIQNKLSRFKSLQQELSEERNMVYEVVEKGKAILHSVNCPSLETAITDLAEKWVSLNTELTKELKRTEILGDQLSTFETDAANLSSWLIAAKKKIASFKQLAPNDLETIAAVRNKVEKVLEFRKEIENQLSLKNRVIEVGNKLLQNKNYDTRGLSDRLSDFEEEWKQLDMSVSEIEKFLYERQMELMPSRQALSELTTWINKIRNSLQKDAQKKVETVADIELMMKKYKDYKIELTSRQMPVDFVNQQILAPQPDEVNVPHEKLEFAEKLGQLNKKWKEVLQNVNERLNSLKSVHAKWEDFDESLRSLQTWFSEQEDTIRRYKLIGHEIGVKQTLKDCKAIQQQLKSKSEDINHLRALGNSLMEISKDSPGCQRSVRDSIVRVEQSKTRLEDQIKKMEGILTDMTDQWGCYHRDLASLNMLLTQTEYSLNQYSLVAGDIVTLRSYVAKLQGLERELNQSAGRLDGFTGLAGQLKQVCEPAVQADIQRTVDDLHARWRQLGSDLTERCHKLKLCQGQWEELDRHYIRIQHWLEEKEAICNEILNARDNPLKQQECLKRLKEIQSELDNYQSEMSGLYQSTDLVMKYLSPSTMAVVRSRNSVLEQRMLTLRKLLSQQTLALTEDLSQLSKFNKAFEAVEKFLNSIQAELRYKDPDRSAEEDVLKGRQNALSNLISSFIINYSKLDAVNDLGYRLALNDYDATRLKELNHRWQRLYEETNDRCRKLREHLLVQQDFAAKCQTWMTFLAQTERDLAKEPKGSLHDLKEQLRQCEHFESEAYSHQQVLHAIIADGMRMMRAGEVEDSEEFQRKLNLLSDQWQSVSRRVHQRRVLIEGLISQWNQFYSLNRQLKQWLEDKEENLKACELETDSLHVIRTLMDKVKTTQHEFASQEATFNKLRELGTHLLHSADHTEAEHVQEILNDLQNHWTRIFGQLGGHRSRFEDVNKQWLDCEGDIEEILNWLKDIRLLLLSDLPTTYDELKKELNTCRDISMDFSNMEGKRQNLIMKERQLSKLIQTEDMNVLCQRIGLLNKQWEELQHQTLLREQRLSEALYRWTNVSQSIQSLIHWIDDMEIKIVSNRDIQVEDLLAKLEKDFRQEMERKEIEKNEIVSQGRHLVRVSSEIRASDIEQKVLRLEEKWERLQALIDFRRKKLQETVLAVKQLDTSMKNLSQWLSSVEAELSGGIAYKETNLKEIQTKLEANKDLQKEIETHSAGVSAVLNLCEVLLHDSDACPTETEFLALQHARKNLEKRWRNICTLSPQRRTRLEETWQMWEQFQKDCQKFSDWLTQAERDVKDSEMEIPNVRVAKEEIHKYEKLQRNVHDHLGDLEQINRHYCQLAKEGRTDMDGSLKVKMTDLNNRWDTLQLKITEIMKKLKNSASILDDFEKTRSSLMTWLRHVELQLNEIQDMTNLDLESKVNDIRNIEDEIQTRQHRMEYLDQAALFLIQKGDSQQALRVQRELDEFKALSKRIFEKLVTTKLRIERLLVAQGDVLFDGREKSYFCLSSEDHLRRVQDSQATMKAKQQTENIQRYRQSSASETSPSIHKSSSSPSIVNVSTGRHSRSPSRWTDSSAQRSQSPSPIRSRSPDRSYTAPTSQPISPSSPRRRMSPSPQRLNTSRRSPSPQRLYTTRRSPSPQRLAARRGSPTHRSLDFTDGTESLHLDASRRERMTKIEVLLEELVDCIEDCNSRLLELETSMGTKGDERQLVQQLVECEVAASKMDSLHRLLKTEMGHESIGSVDHEVKLTQQKWQKLKLSASEQNSRSSQELAQFSTNLDKMLAWLDEAEALQSTQRPIPVDIDQLNIVIRQYTDFMTKVESQRVLISSINLMSSGYLMANNATTRQLNGKLQEMNNRWDRVLNTATEMGRDLQVSLIECQEFHHNIQDYILWLENLEQKVHYCEPINSGDQQKLKEKYQILLDVYENLESKQSKIVFLRETADKLLINTSIPEMATTRDNIHTISRRMRSLINLTSSYIASLEKKLQFSKSKQKTAYKRDEVSSLGLSSWHSADPLSSQPIRTSRIKSRNQSPFSITRKPLKGSTGPLLCTRPQDRDNLSTELDSSSEAIHSTRIRPNLLMRVIRAAIPFLLLLLLLFLLFACLVPYCEDEYSCLHSNNLRNSLTPMLSYTDGAPPI